MTTATGRRCKAGKTDVGRPSPRRVRQRCGLAAGTCLILVSASAVSDPVETLLNVIVAIVFGALAAIAAFFAAIFSLFKS